jgi:hypothetical protein
MINSNYYDNLSRYYKGVDIIQINLSNKTRAFPLMFTQPRFEDKDIRLFYTVDQSEQGRLDLIAFKIYGNSKLWWVIAAANLIEDTLKLPIAGDILKIPSLDSLTNKNFI